MIRPAAIADLPAICAIWDACGDALPQVDAAGRDALLRRNIARGSAVVAVWDGEVAGVCVWSPVLRRISLLAVSPAARGQGIATALMREALAALPPGDVTVETFRDDDPRGAAALTLYRKLGFVPDGELDGYETPMQKLRLCR